MASAMSSTVGPGGTSGEGSVDRAHCRMPTCQQWRDGHKSVLLTTMRAVPGEETSSNAADPGMVVDPVWDKMSEGDEGSSDSGSSLPLLSSVN